MAKCVKENKAFLQGLKKYYLCELILLVGWVVNFVFFWKFYEQAVFYVDKEAKFIVQLLFISTYYLSDVLIYLFSSFLLMTLNMLLLLILHSKDKRSSVKSKQAKILLNFSSLIIVVNLILLLRTIVWPLFLLMFIASVTIVYIVYAVTKYLYEEQEESYEENELIKEMGSFETKEAADEYSDHFLAYWSKEFEKKGYCLISTVKNNPENGWHVEIIVQSIK